MKQYKYTFLIVETQMKNSKNRICRFWAFLGDLRHSVSKWTNYSFLVLTLAVGLAMGSCGQIRYIPVETDTKVEVKDSTVYHIKDSVRVIERSRWKDYGGLMDTLRIRGNRAEMTAWTDTTRNIINGSLEEDPLEEKTRIVYRDRWKVRDSLVFKEVPVEVTVEKEVKVVPKFWKFTGMVGILFLIGLLTITGWKVYGFFKGKGILKIFKKSV